MYIVRVEETGPASPNALKFADALAGVHTNYELPRVFVFMLSCGPRDAHLCVFILGPAKHEALSHRLTRGPNVSRVICQPREPQVGLPNSTLSATSEQTENTTPSILTEPGAVAQGIASVTEGCDGGVDAFRRGGGYQSLVVPSVARFCQQTPLTTCMIPHDQETKGIGSTPTRGTGMSSSGWKPYLRPNFVVHSG